MKIFTLILLLVSGLNSATAETQYPPRVMSSVIGAKVVKTKRTSQIQIPAKIIGFELVTSFNGCTSNIYLLAEIPTSGKIEKIETKLNRIGNLMVQTYDSTFAVGLLDNRDYDLIRKRRKQCIDKTARNEFSRGIRAKRDALYPIQNLRVNLVKVNQIDYIKIPNHCDYSGINCSKEAKIEKKESEFLVWKISSRGQQAETSYDYKLNSND